jgi:arylformamidase
VPLIDVSRPLHNGLAVWPGDTAFDFRLTSQISDGAAANVGAITMGAHNGAHADAPCHFQSGAAGIDALELGVFMGPATLADVSMRPGGPFAPILPEYLSDAGAALTRTRRLLLKTGGWPDPSQFPERIPTLSPDAINWLAERGVILLGLDVPSVDAIDSKTLPNHHALYAAGIHILESLDLSAAPPGDCELIALPLRIVGGDAAPVRAVLRVGEA